jgi:hypothetical protein
VSADKVTNYEQHVCLEKKLNRMKQIIVTVIITLTILSCGISCKQFTQLYQTSSPKLTKNDNYWVFENDTLKITYNFWAPRGILSFTVFNKLNEPIYIDWKKCSFVRKTEKLDYWVDEETTNTETYYKGFNANFSGFRPVISVVEGGNVVTYGNNFSSGVSTGSSVSQSKKIKPERITFIAPQSTIYKSNFFIYNLGGTKLNLDRDTLIQKRNDSPKKTTTVYLADYTLEDSPLFFRNFLTFSTSEKFDKEFYVDNIFFINKIVEMDRNHFTGGFKKENSYEYEMPYRVATSFYIDIEAPASIEVRKKYKLD